MTRIQKLPAQVVNKIAAGEVIERPAAAVKELVENALDAGAAQIEVTIEDGGARGIRVADDGHGMGQDDLELAFASHATSKIVDVEDLDAVGTLGFRGEALASIGAVARCRIRSRTPNADIGHEIRCEGGVVSEVEEVGTPVGTTVTVDGLFFNTPVRRKFLKTKATELSHVTATITRLALAHPQVGFVLVHEGREVLRLNAQAAEGLAALRERVGELFGGDVQRDLMPVEAEGAVGQLTGFVLPIAHSRRDTGGIYTFLNGRFLRDKVLIAAVTRAYKELLPHGRNPLVFLHLLMDPREVDVNVHPTKTEVRFRRSGEVHSFVHAAVSRTVRTSDSTPSLRVGSHGYGATVAEPRRPALPASTPASGSERARDLFANVSPPPRTAPRDPVMASPTPSAQLPFDRKSAYQLHNAFLVEETPEGIAIIDQHALHERILTERIRERIQADGLPAQRLLQPVVVRLAPAEIGRCLQLRESLARFGLELDRMGEESVAVHALPTMLANKLGEVEVAELVKALVREASDREVQGEGGAVDETRFLDRAIYNMACRAAVKIGDPLSASEIHAILRMRDEIEGRHLTCPHGRPTTLNLSLDDLRRRFERE